VRKITKNETMSYEIQIFKGGKAFFFAKQQIAGDCLSPGSNISKLQRTQLHMFFKEIVEMRYLGKT